MVLPWKLRSFSTKTPGLPSGAGSTQRLTSQPLMSYLQARIWGTQQHPALHGARHTGTPTVHNQTGASTGDCSNPQRTPILSRASVSASIGRVWAPGVGGYTPSRTGPRPPEANSPLGQAAGGIEDALHDDEVFLGTGHRVRKDRRPPVAIPPAGPPPPPHPPSCPGPPADCALLEGDRAPGEGPKLCSPGGPGPSSRPRLLRAVASPARPSSCAPRPLKVPVLTPHLG